MCLTAAADIYMYELLLRDQLGERIEPASDYAQDLHMVEQRTTQFPSASTMLSDDPA